jgi:hypothetical protein
MESFVKCAYCGTSHNIRDWEKQIRQTAVGFWVCIDCLVARHQKLVQLELGIGAIREALEEK